MDTFRLSELLIGFYVGNLYAYSSSIRDYYFLFNVIILLSYLIFIFKEQGQEAMKEPVLNLAVGCILSILFNTLFSLRPADNGGFVRVSDDRSRLYWKRKKNGDKNKDVSCYDKYEK
jgi:hypothetical protein